MSAAPRPTKPIVPKRVRPTMPSAGQAPLEGARFVVCVPDVTARLERRRWHVSLTTTAAAFVRLRWLPRPRGSVDLWRLPLQLLSPQLWMQPKLLLPVICAVVLVLVAAIIQGNRTSVDADSPEFAPDWRAPVVDLPDNASGQQAAADAPRATAQPRASATATQPPANRQQPAAAANVATPHPQSSQTAAPGASPPQVATGADTNQPAKIEPSPPEHRTARVPERPRDPPRGNVDAQPPTAHREGKIISAPVDYQR